MRKLRDNKFSFVRLNFFKILMPIMHGKHFVRSIVCRYVPIMQADIYAADAWAEVLYRCIFPDTLGFRNVCI